MRIILSLANKYMGKYKSTAVLAPIFVLIETVAGLLMPVLMARILNQGVNAGNMDVIWQCGLQMVGLAFVHIVTGIYAGRLTTVSSNGFGSRLRVAVYHHMQNFSFADVDKFSTASLITRLTGDVRTLQMSIQMGLRMLIQCPFQLVVAMFIVFTYNWKIALIYLALIPILFTGVMMIQRVVRHMFTLMREKVDNMNAALQENLIAIRVVKSFVREEHEREKFKVANEDLTRTNMRTMSRMQIMGPMASIIINTGLISVYWLGGHMVGYGEIPVGTLVAITSYLMQIMMSIMMFSMVYMQVTRAQACAERINEVLDAVPDIIDSGKEVVIAEQGESTKPEEYPEGTIVIGREDVGRVEFRNVSFKYSLTGTGEDVLRDISFVANPGETVAIVGDTGAGKSSLVNLIARFYDVTGGEVLVNGVDVRDYNLTALRDNIGMVLQKNVLFSGSIRDNMRWGKPDATDEEIIEALKSAQAYKFVMEEFPRGLDTEIQQGGTNVSGGQKQRLCIARAILKNPSILILDDSTSAVDSDTESKIREAFNTVLDHCTVFIIAQRISSVVSADKIIVLEDGKIESIGSHSELMQSSSVYNEIYTSQQEGGFANG